MRTRDAGEAAHEASWPDGCVDSVARLAELVRGKPGLFVRYSRGPEADRSGSRDYESGLDLPGLSCNALDAEAWWTLPLEQWLARKICNYAHLRDEARDERYAWILSGDVVARGPDNEPLIADAQPVARLADEAIDEAKALYDECFEVGKDSRG